MKKLLKRLLPEGLKDRSRSLRAKGIAVLAGRTNLTRGPLSQIFVRGQGIEVGALNWPLEVPSGCQTKYVDCLSVEMLRERYPELANVSFPVDIVAQIETLEGIADESQDYAIANHVVEHSRNPIRALHSLLRVLKVGGVLFLTLPDKRFTFDVKREITPFAHVLRDYQEGSDWGDLDHYRDFARNVLEGIEEDKIEETAVRMHANQDDIHFHVWTQIEMLEMLTRTHLELGFPFEFEIMSKTGLEAIFVMRKTGSMPPAP